MCLLGNNGGDSRFSLQGGAWRNYPFRRHNCYYQDVQGE